MNPVVIEKDGKKYTLEFNRNSVKAMERNGFSLDEEYVSKYANFSESLVKGAFLAHHKALSAKIIDDIIESLIEAKKLGAVTKKLIDLYAETITTLYGTDEEENEEEDGDFFAL